MKILATGLNGLLGSRIQELLQNKYTFENISLQTGVDIVNYDQIFSIFKSTDAQLVLHLAAKTNVDACEEDKKEGTLGQAWKVNVEGTRNIAKACSYFNKRLIHISTAFVFDGTKEYYLEDDKRNAVNWYGQTKLEAEKIVEELKIPWIIIRPDFPYRAAYEVNDFMRSLKSLLEQKKDFKAVTDSYFCPTFIDDIAVVIDKLISQKAKGIYHSVGSTLLTPYEATLAIGKVFNLDTSRVIKTTRNEFFKGKADRPFRLDLRNDRIEKLGLYNKSFEKGLLTIKSQLDL